MQFIDYGDGRSGSAASISGTVNTYATCTATSGTRTVTTSLTVSVGDQVVLHQTKGSGATNWEIVKVATVGGGSFTTTTNLDNTYASGAQAILVPQYTTGTTGALTAQDWNGTTGGIGFILGNGAITIGSAFNNTADGQGYDPGGGLTNKAGFRGDGRNSGLSGGADASQGEGTPGSGSVSQSPNGNGGGGGAQSPGHKGGAGGGNGTAGTDSDSTGGLAVGSSSLSTMSLGGGGGGGSGDTGSEYGGAAGNGGGIIVIIAPTITLSAAVKVNGGGGDPSSGGAQGGGGGGAGGSILLKGQTIVLGSNNATALGGAGATGNAQGNGGAGGSGRIAVYAPSSSSVTGTTNPSYTFVADNTLAGQTQGFII